jgi:hypothetical protein
MMSGRPQGGPYYRTPPQQQLQTPPGPPYGTQDPLAHGGYYPPFFQPPNSNAPPVGHPSAHNVNIWIISKNQICKFFSFSYMAKMKVFILLILKCLHVVVQ